MHYLFRRIALGAVLLATALSLAAQQAPSVVVAEVISRDVTPSFDYVGRVEAVDRVSLRARVQGVLEQRLFREGASIREGEPLFVIEKAPYEIVVKQRQADLAGAEATLKNARADLARKQELLAQQVISKSDVDAAEAVESTAVAAVLQAQAALERAQLDLSYTDIFSPIDGQVSQATLSVGNLVSVDSDPLATVIRMDPVHVNIAVSAKDLLQARREGIDLDRPKVKPELFLSDGQRYQHEGFFDYLDTEVDRSTDTVLARAVFPNPERVLIPGQFVRVTVKRKIAEKALVVPQIAVQEDQQGYFVLVVDAVNRVEQRRVELDRQLESEWVVTGGLAAGERVIVQGVQKVRPDMVVNPVVDDS